MLFITESACQKLENKENIKVEDLEQLTEFLNTFVYSIHHQKEENFLFNKIENPKISAASEDHDEEKELFENLLSGIQGYKESNNSEDLINNARGYTSFVNNHLNHEEENIYPLINQGLTEEDNGLLNSFEELENENITEEKAEEYQRLLTRLAQSYLGEDLHTCDCDHEHGDCDCKEPCDDCDHEHNHNHSK